ncbi:hypothetical protein HJD18_05655 [Thermoleophilia bacterium SCSIO 60948]|nr:hypothetical protein HJD18_05655 [Thermoleophilia bacterium SCSIO 60948]
MGIQNRNGLTGRRLTTLGLAAAGAFLLAVAVAAAATVVYSNDFSNRSEAKELRPVSKSKRCDRKYASKQKALRLSVKGKTSCSYAPPVEGDGAAPNLTVTLDARMPKGTPKALRKTSYLSAGVRGGYTLRVFPGSKRFELVRRPTGGGSDFPADGRDAKIGGLGDRNNLQVTAKGDRIVAKVNGKAVARVRDTDAGQVDGRGVEVGAGSMKASKRPTKATLGKVKVAIPK